MAHVHKHPSYELDSERNFRFALLGVIVVTFVIGLALIFAGL